MENNITPEDVKALEEKHEQTLISYNTTRTLLSEAESKLAQTVTFVTEQEAYLTKLDEKKARLEEELAEVAEVIVEQTNAANIVRKEAAEAGKLASNAKEAIRQEMDTLEKERLALIEAVADLVEQRRALEEDITAKRLDLETELTLKQDEIADLTRAVEDFREMYNDLKFSIADAEQILQEVQERAEEDARTSLRRTEAAENRVADLGVEAGNLIERKETLLSDIDSLETELVEKHGILQKITAGIESFEKDTTELQTFHRHVLSKEEHVREMFEQIGKPYPEFK